MSVAASIRSAVVAGAQALSLVPSGSVIARKIPGLPQGKTAPAVSVSVTDDGEAELLWAGTVAVKYRVAVTYISATTGEQSQTAAVDTARELIRKKVLDPTTYAGVGGFNEVTVSGSTPFEASGLDANYNYSTVNCVVECIEDRS